MRGFRSIGSAPLGVPGGNTLKSSIYLGDIIFSMEMTALDLNEMFSNIVFGPFSVSSVYKVATALTGNVTPGQFTVSSALTVDNAMTNIVNVVRNSMMVGASPGTFPLNYRGHLSTSGVTATCVGAGIDDFGFPYVDIRLLGTATQSAVFDIAFVAGNEIPASEGETWTGSIAASIVAGTRPNGVSLNVSARNASGGGVRLDNLNLSDALVGSPHTRYSFTPLPMPVGTERVQAHLRSNFLVGQTLDVTFRVSQPQLERGELSDFVPSYDVINGGARPIGNFVSSGSMAAEVSMQVAVALSDGPYRTNYNLNSVPSIGTGVSFVAQADHPLGYPTTKITRTTSVASAYSQTFLSSSVFKDKSELTASCLAKGMGAGQYLCMRIQASYPDRIDAIFDLDTGVVVHSAGINFSGVSARITPDGYGFYLCEVTGTPVGSTVTTAVVGPSSRTTSGWEGSTADLSSVIVSALQVEKSPFATDRIVIDGGRTAPASVGTGGISTAATFGNVAALSSSIYLEDISTSGFFAAALAISANLTFGNITGAGVLQAASALSSAAAFGPITTAGAFTVSDALVGNIIIPPITTSGQFVVSVAMNSSILLLPITTQGLFAGAVAFNCSITLQPITTTATFGTLVAMVGAAQFANFNLASVLTAPRRRIGASRFIVLEEGWSDVRHYTIYD